MAWTAIGSETAAAVASTGAAGEKAGSGAVEAVAAGTVAGIVARDIDAAVRGTAEHRCVGSTSVDFLSAPVEPADEVADIAVENLAPDNLPQTVPARCLHPSASLVPFAADSSFPQENP